VAGAALAGAALVAAPAIIAACALRHLLASTASAGSSLTQGLPHSTPVAACSAQCAWCCTVSWLALPLLILLLLLLLLLLLPP
jgi:hypothetical protein